VVVADDDLTLIGDDTDARRTKTRHTLHGRRAHLPVAFRCRHVFIYSKKDVADRDILRSHPAQTERQHTSVGSHAVAPVHHHGDVVLAGDRREHTGERVLLDPEFDVVLLPLPARQAVPVGGRVDELLDA